MDAVHFKKGEAVPKQVKVCDKNNVVGPAGGLEPGEKTGDSDKMA